uniref:COMM domain-containing protein n=1 Tax=Hemiselmis andersenii TaxID=464988 RepID=A0A7S0TU75_HEMAN|mmetsp:Transcript_24190/g.55835  ORF Transcript_24190/g.55835 Transcript_24190/m.55835 type:complete len:210 (+) Transcript_24190:151-780(+)
MEGGGGAAHAGWTGEEPVDAEALEVLLQAPSKAQVNEVFLLAFRARHGQTDALVEKAASKLGGAASKEETVRLLRAANQLIMRAVYLSLDAEGVVGLLPSDFHQALGGLIGTIVAHHASEWRELIIASQVSEPRLLDMNWRGGVKAASNHITTMSVPTCFVGLQVQDSPQRKDELPPVSNITFELNKEELETMLGGLTKLRDQLSGVAQ